MKVSEPRSFVQFSSDNRAGLRTFLDFFANNSDHKLLFLKSGLNWE